MTAIIGRRAIPYRTTVLYHNRPQTAICDYYAALFSAVLEQYRKDGFCMSENRIPDDVLSNYVREYVNSTRRESYARHPERVMRQRLTSAANLLNRHGLIDDRQRASILEAVKEASA